MCYVDNSSSTEVYWASKVIDTTLNWRRRLWISISLSHSSSTYRRSSLSHNDKASSSAWWLCYWWSLERRKADGDDQVAADECLEGINLAKASILYYQTLDILGENCDPILKSRLNFLQLERRFHYCMSGWVDGWLAGRMTRYRTGCSLAIITITFRVSHQS